MKRLAMTKSFTKNFHTKKKYMQSKLKLPKSVYLNKNKKVRVYSVNIHSKKYDKNLHVGYYETIEEAIIARDKFVVENYSDLTEGYLPRGMTKNGKNYRVYFQFKGQEEYLGTFETIKEAVEFRNKYIDSLK